MPIDFNLSILGGRLTSDPKSIADGRGCRFDIAINRRYKKDGKQEEETTYLPVTCWSYLAKTVLDHCGKGDSVLVEGRLETRIGKTAEGQDRKYMNVVANDVRFVGGGRNRTEVPYPSKPQSEFPEGVNAETEDLLRNLLDK